MPKRAATSSPSPPPASATGKQSKMMPAAAGKLHAYDWARAQRYLQEKEEQHDRELENARKTLEAMYKERKEPSAQDKKNATFRQWFMQYADDNFPDLGKVTYCVPHFYIGDVPLKPVGDTGAYDIIQECDLRGENAQRKVVRAFTLLSHRLEQEEGQAMFIMTNVLYENVLKQAKDAERDMGGTSSSVFEFVPKKENRKESDVIILHEQKGVILVQVKSIGTHPVGRTAGGKKKDVSEQLNNDEQNFRKIMAPNAQDVQVHKVAALPNLTSTQVEEHCTIYQGVQGHETLTKDDLFEDRLDVAESEYDLKNVKAWWKRLSIKKLDKEVMKEIIGRYIGTLSRPVDTNFTTERSHARTVCDSVALAARHAKTLCLKLSDHTEQAVSSHTTQYKRVHLRGAPGSGRTTMLILKAASFLKRERTKVVVVDLCRGPHHYLGQLGRPVCHRIVQAIQRSEEGKYEGNVHHLPLNVHDKVTADDFKQKVPGDVKETDILFVIDEILPEEEWRGVLQALQEDFKDSHVWCADGILPQQLSARWTFRIVKLRGIHRIPHSVQRVLWHADWDRDAERIESYTPDADTGPERQILASNGPTPVCIRHADQPGCDPDVPVIGCAKCAEDLAATLVSMDMVKGTQAGPSTGGQGETSQSSQQTDYLPCSIAILFGLPQDRYTRYTSKAETIYVETTEEDVRKYVEPLKTCSFVTKLRECLAAKVTVLDPFSPDRKDDLDDLWNDVIVSWTDFFTGLERDVVVYLPGDTRGSGGPRVRVVPMPGVRRGAEADRRAESPTTSSADRQAESPTRSADRQAESPTRSADRQAESPTRSADRQAESPTSSADRQAESPTRSADRQAESPTRSADRQAESPTSSADRQAESPTRSADRQAESPTRSADRQAESPTSSADRQAESPTSSAGSRSAVAAGGSLTNRHWRVGDLTRYTDLDHANLAWAATRCCGQLIMMVP